MIRNTFSILNGVGEKTEKRLWRRGILTWKDFIRSSDVGVFSPGRKSLFDERLEAAQSNLADRNAVFFRDAVSTREHWRLFETFRDDAVCLDIETNGFQPEAGGYPTVVGVYDGFGYRAFVRGEDLDAPRLMQYLSGYKYLITFFGSVFDIPYLEKSLPGFELRIPHFDLCFGARRLGMQGGLKRLEAELGIEREESTRGLDGYDAVLLWRRALRGSGEAMRLLIRYNREDTVNLMGIAGTIYGRLRASTGIEDYLGKWC